MVTPVAVSVGVGQTYTTLNAALATLPASTVTADQEWTFNLYTGSVFAACSKYPSGRWSEVQQSANGCTGTAAGAKF